MLVDINPDLDPDLLTPIRGFQCRYERIAPGVYSPGTSGGLRLEFEGIITNEFPFTPKFEPGLGVEERVRQALEYYDQNPPRDFGTCDFWQQVPARWPELVTSDRLFVIEVRKVYRDHQLPHGGWRWHKHGEYIGVLEPQREYLADEPDIDEVTCFHIFEIHSWATTLITEGH